MNVHVIGQLFFEQFHILSTIHGGTRGQKVQSSGARITRYTQNNLTRWVLHRVFLITSSQAAFSHAEYTPQTAVLGICPRTKSYPTVQLPNLYISWHEPNHQISQQLINMAYEQVYMSSYQTHCSDIMKRSSCSHWYLLQANTSLHKLNVDCVAMGFTMKSSLILIFHSFQCRYVPYFRKFFIAS